MIAIPCPKLLILVRRYFGPKPIWLTQSLQTNPPDTFLGVAPQEAGNAPEPRGDACVEAVTGHHADPYLYRDEPALGRFQTGLVFANDRLKPSLQGFELPFAEMRRVGFETRVWGQIRGGRPGRKRYRLEVLHRNEWKAVGHDRLTNDAGVFIRTIRLKRGALLRVWAPPRQRFSLQLRVGESASGDLPMTNKASTTPRREAG